MTGARICGSARRLGVQAIVLAVVLAAAAVVLTWPLFRHPATTVLEAKSLYGPAATLIQRDINLTLWVLAWDTHALLSDPGRLFHANALWPAPYTLALSEHMLGNVPVFAPIYMLTGNPVLAHQVTLLATFVVAGLTMAAWVLYWTGDRASAAAAAFLFAFAPYRLWQLGSLHVISIHWLPLILLGVDASVHGRAPRAGPLAVFCALLLSAACSYYVGYAAFLLAAVYLGSGAMARGRSARRAVGVIAGVTLLAAVAMAALSVPYLRLRQLGILPDHAQSGFVSLAFLAALRDGIGGTVWRFLHPGEEGIPLYLGAAVLPLAAAGTVAHRGHPRAALLLTAILGFVLSLGPTMATPLGMVPLPYRWLASVVPGFDAMRVPQRFAALVTLASVALAALGLAACRRWLAGRGWARIAALLPLATVAASWLDVRPPSIAARPMPVDEAVPAAYRWLAEHGAGKPLIELPASAGAPYRQSLSMYFSTFHWLPLANGYTPYGPPTFRAIFEAAEGLPEPEALERLLDAAPLHWLLVWRAWVPQDTWPAWRATFDARLRLVEDFGDVLLYARP